ncbi:unnamed protein product [Durusdinium trenchii]|uniref:PH domain-containing protein n=1 Tax=Durusdinium trenchii TaxID=1381693 RepID=A0ABP0SIK3_9DINO
MAETRRRPLLELKEEALALSRARRLKVGKGSPDSALQVASRRTLSPDKEPEADENLAAPSKDIYIEAKELQRAHRVLTASDSESKPFGGFWHTPSPCRKRAMCPVCGASTTPRGSDGTLDEPSTEKDLGIQVEILEDLLAQSRPVASEAKRLQHQLASTEARLADTQAALDLAMGLCQELHSAMELQTADFQRFVEDLRRACGAWMEQRQQLEVELDTMVKLCLPGNKQIADLHEELHSARQKLQVSRKRGSRRASTRSHHATIQALQAQLQDAQTQGGHTTREALLELQERLHRKNDELLAVEAKNAQLEAQKAHAEDQVLTLQADLEQAQQGVAEAKREVKSSRAATRAKRAQEVPQGLVVRSLDMLSKGEVVWKLCAANGKWQERFMAVTPGPPAAPESLKWSKDAGRRKLRRPSSVGLQEIVHVGFGAEALPARHKAQVTKPWCCFSVWTAQRSFHFKAESELIAENFVLGLSRLCPGTKPTPVRDVVLHRALGKMGPDAKSRAAALSKALRAASASASAAQGLGEPDRVTHGEEEEEVHFARLGTALSEALDEGSVAIGGSVGALCQRVPGPTNAFRRGGVGRQFFTDVVQQQRGKELSGNYHNTGHIRQ